jgi:cellulose synthase/poly-beta-1,6-N-acetylglucosamine synthase-like glycosyltransferase
VTRHGRIIGTILSFVGLAIVLGFISNIGSTIIESRKVNRQKRLGDETKSSIINRVDNIEQLNEEEFIERNIYSLDFK